LAITIRLFGSTNEATETKIIPLFFFAIAVVLFALTIIDLMALSSPERFHYGPALHAEKLLEKPDKYMSLANVDSYVLQAITTPGNVVFVGSWDNTQFDELMLTYETNNVEYNGNYYRIDLLNADAFAYGTYFWLLMIGWGILVISIAITARRNRRKSSDSV